MFTKRLRGLRATFGTVAQDWLELRRDEVKPATLANYRTLFRAHLLPEFGPLPVCRITEARVRNYLDRLAASGLSASTRRSIQLTLQMILRHAAGQGLMRPVNFPPLPPLRRQPAVILTDTEFFQLEDTLRRHLDGQALGILLCMYTGLRIGEVCALRWGDIDLAAGMVTVSRTLQRISDGPGTHILIDTPKSQNSIRSIPLPRPLLDLMRPFAGPPTAYLLTGGPGFMEPRQLQRQFKCILAASGLRPVKFHTLRHTFATRCAPLTDPKTLSRLLGHGSIATTMDVYVHPGTEQLRRCLERLSA